MIYKLETGLLLTMTMSNQTTTKTEIAGTRESESEELLRVTLKRCSPDALEAALKYRANGDVSLVPVVVLGIIERFLDPDVIGKLRGGDDSVRFMDDLGMDSLTMIEAIMMVEESLGISIKNEELLDLRTLGDLKSFIQAKITGHSSGEKSDFYSIEKVAAIMPQQEPFLFLEQANLSNRSAEGKYTISGNETFLEGHFKGNPVFPASIMLEALGQLAVFALLKNPPEEIESTIDMTEVYFTGVDGVRCHRVCRPGEILDMSITVKRVRDPLAVFSGQISVGGEKAVVAEEITLAFMPVDHHSNGVGAAVNGFSASNGSELSRNGAH